MSIVAGYLLPHAPVFIKQIGAEQISKVQETIHAFEIIASEIEKINPDLIIIISPHGPIFSDAIAVYDFPEYYGDLKAFGEYTLSYKVLKDSKFIQELIEKSNASNGYFYPLSKDKFIKFQHEPVLDHGVTVPLHFALKDLNHVKLVAMSYGTLSYLELMKNGELLNQVSEASGKKIVIIASGDMSHALSSKGPYKYHADGPWFDMKMCDFIENQQPFDIFTESEVKISNAAECGLRSFAIMMGTFNKTKVVSRVYNYEGPFGVGYLIAGFKPNGKSEINVIENIESDMINQVKKAKANAHLYVKIAGETIKNHIKTKRDPLWIINENSLSINNMSFSCIGEKELLNQQRGVFVTIKKHGLLRGCIGTIEPVEENMFKEIVRNAISACSQDYRFDPVSIDELEELTISVDVLSELRLVEDQNKLSTSKFGIVVYSKGRKGVLLPNIEGINMVEEQIKIASNKGGFRVDEIDKIQCFTVERFH